MVRKGNDGNDYQGIKYKASNVSAPQTESAVETPAEEVTENPFEDLPTDTEVEW